MIYDLVIIGGGPAGAGAAVYAARKKIKTLIITDAWGGQSIVSADVHNWIGTTSISGFDLAKALEEHVRAYQSDLELWESDRAVSVAKQDDYFVMTTERGKTAEAKTILVASGSRRKRLGVPGEDRLDGRGIAWCSTCDAPLFKGKTVAVIGGGNAGLEATLDLNAYAEKIYLLHRKDRLKGDPITQEKVMAMPKVAVIYNALTQEILGDQFVSSLRYKDALTGEEKMLPAEGVFIEVGSVPNTEFLKGLAAVNDFGEIVVDHKTQATSTPGLWAAGDVSDVLYKQNNVSVGDAIKALLNIDASLHRR